MRWDGLWLYVHEGNIVIIRTALVVLHQWYPLTFLFSSQPKSLRPYFVFHILWGFYILITTCNM